MRNDTDWPVHVCSNRSVGLGRSLAACQTRSQMKSSRRDAIYRYSKAIMFGESCQTAVNFLEQLSHFASFYANNRL